MYQKLKSSERYEGKNQKLYYKESSNERHVTARERANLCCRLIENLPSVPPSL